MGFWERDATNGFDKMFDFNSDGKIDLAEDGAKFMFIEDMFSEKQNHQSNYKGYVDNSSEVENNKKYSNTEKDSVPVQFFTLVWMIIHLGVFLFGCLALIYFLGSLIFNIEDSIIYFGITFISFIVFFILLKIDDMLIKGYGRGRKL